MTDKIVLTVANRRYEGWQEISVVRSLMQPAHSFRLMLTETFFVNQTQVNIRAGQACHITLDNELLISGYIDDVVIEYGEGKHQITVTGYSKVRDLMLSSALVPPFKNQSLLQIARSLCAPFGINIKIAHGAHSQANKPFAHQALDAGQPVYEFLNQLARHRGVMLTSSADGDLVITKASKSRVNTPIKLGVNIQKCMARFSAADVHNQYILAGQGSVWDATDSNPLSSIKAKAKGELITRHKPLVMRTSTPLTQGQANSKIKAERNVREGRSQSIQYTLARWRMGEQKPIWPINQLVKVDDDYIDIQGELLIAQTRFVMNSKGQSTELVLVPPAAFDPIIEPEPLSPWSASSAI